jgi:hypothetical protein
VRGRAILNIHFPIGLFSYYGSSDLHGKIHAGRHTLRNPRFGFDAATPPTGKKFAIEPSVIYRFAGGLFSVVVSNALAPVSIL